MPPELTNMWRRLPTAGDAFVPEKGLALGADFGTILAENMNYALAAKVPQVIMSGNRHTSDYGEFSGLSGDYSATPGNYVLGPRGRAVVWQPFSGTLGYAFKAATMSDVEEATVEIYAGDTPWPASTPVGRYVKKRVTVLGGGSSLVAYVGTITEDEDNKYKEVPLAIDGMCFVYFRLEGIAMFGSYCVWAGAKTS